MLNEIDSKVILKFLEIFLRLEIVIGEVWRVIPPGGGE